MSEGMPLRRKVLLLMFGHGLVLAVLVALAPLTFGDPAIRQQGIWFPVTLHMPPTALAYALIGKSYILGMFSWAIYGLQRVARHFLRHPIMRLGAWLGLCVACGMLLQSLVVALAQAQGVNFYATRAGQATLSLWLTMGFLLPLAAITVVGGVNRWRLFWLARDLRAFAQYLLITVSRAQPERGREVDEWRDRVFGSNADLVTTAYGSPGVAVPPTSAMAYHVWSRFTALLLEASQTIHTPTGGVDSLETFLRDVIDAVYPHPGDAMLLAALWLWRQPSTTAQRLTERDVAALLLAATLIGGEHGLFAPVPLSAPEPLQHAFVLADGRDWRQWGSPVGASFLRNVWRLLTTSSPAGFAPEVREGVSALRGFLSLLTAEERADLLERWMGVLEQRAEALAASPQGIGQDDNGNRNARDALPPDVLAHWWRPLDPRPPGA